VFCHAASLDQGRVAVSLRDFGCALFCNGGLTVGTLEGWFIILWFWETLLHLSHSSWHSDCFHQSLFLIRKHGGELIKSSCEVVKEAWHAENFLTAWSLCWPDLKAALQHKLEVSSKVVWNWIIFS